VARFRKYLGEQYAKKTAINDVETMLPITTIYILGNKLVGLDSPCIKVRRIYTDSISGETLNAKSGFVELLTHDCHVIQAGRITDVRYTTNLNKLLSIFEQAYFIRNDSEVMKEYHYQPDDENMELITSVLHEMAADSEERKQIETEEEALRMLDDLFGYEIRESKGIIEEKDKAIEEKDKTIEEQAKQIEELKRLLQGT
jgi:hypothetical protein